MDCANVFITSYTRRAGILAGIIAKSALRKINGIATLGLEMEFAKNVSVPKLRCRKPEIHMILH